MNLITFAYGITCAWPSVSVPLLGSEESPIGPQSTDVLSWIVGIMCLGGLVGNIFFGWAADIYGRKKPLWLLSIPTLVCNHQIYKLKVIKFMLNIYLQISFLLILYAQNEYYILTARFLGGFVGGGVFVIVPIFIAEIAEDNIRGLLSSFLVFNCTLGCLFAFVFGHFLTYHRAAMLYSIFPILGAIAIYFLPETPIYLMRLNKTDEAEKSLLFYRNKRQFPSNDDPELEKLKKSESSKSEDNKNDTLKLSDFSK